MDMTNWGQHIYIGDYIRDYIWYHAATTNGDSTYQDYIRDNMDMAN